MTRLIKRLFTKRLPVIKHPKGYYLDDWEIEKDIIYSYRRLKNDINNNDSRLIYDIKYFCICNECTYTVDSKNKTIVFRDIV